MADKPRLVFVVTEDWYFYSHRRPMIKAAQQAGFEVYVITKIDKLQAEIEALGVKVVAFDFARRSLNPLKALCQVRSLSRIYKDIQPDIVHHIAMKPILFGSLAAWCARVPHVLNAFAGLGYLFNARTPRAFCLRAVLWPLFFPLMRRKNTHLLFQNDDDLATLKRLGFVVDARTHVIRGSGVDMAQYKALQIAVNDDVICTFAGRMIGIKGLPTLKDAFALLQKRAPHIKLWLCGQPDSENPGSWTEQALQDWDANSDNVTYKGQVSDMAAVWGQCHVGIQASYGGEGVPKSLLEAAACGRAIVATDVPGCRDVVCEPENGYLVPAYDAQALADALEKIASDPARLKAMGQRSRAIVQERFSADIVQSQTQALYLEILKA